MRRSRSPFQEHPTPFTGVCSLCHARHDSKAEATTFSPRGLFLHKSRFHVRTWNLDIPMSCPSLLLSASHTSRDSRAWEVSLILSELSCRVRIRHGKVPFIIFDNNRKINGLGIWVYYCLGRCALDRYNSSRDFRTICSWLQMPSCGISCSLL